jgi:phosphoribosylanthranilate isomerase
VTIESPFQDFIQIAGVRDRLEAELLVECGVRYLGFPLRLPVNEEDLTETEAARLIRSPRPPAVGVLITYVDKANAIVDFMAELGASVVQLHGDICRGELQKLRQARPDIRVIKSLVVGKGDPADLEDRVDSLAGFVDAFITDTFDPATGASGATGKTHDWRISRRLRALSPKPLILGGASTRTTCGKPLPSCARPAWTRTPAWRTPREERTRSRCGPFLAEAREGFRQMRLPASRENQGL